MEDNAPNPTQAATKSQVVYHWVILFYYSPDAEYPFACVNLKELENCGFPSHLVEGPLDDESRQTPFELFQSQRYCLFAKIERGKLITITVNKTLIKCINL